MSKRAQSQIAQKTALLGILFALSLVLSLFEMALPAMPFLPPGVKLGLSNIVVMYTLFFLNLPSALCIAVLKSLFVLLMRGGVAFAMSLSGGLCSSLMIWALGHIKGLSYPFLSVVGALFHNIGQLLMACFILTSLNVLYYLPILAVSGVLTGLVTGLLFNLVAPKLQQLGLRLCKIQPRGRQK